jgi:hypothetical protein
MKRLYIASGIAVALAVTFAACNGKSPSGPSGVTPRDHRIYSLVGTISEPIDLPVENATVTVLDGPHRGKYATTGLDGRYYLYDVDGGLTIQVSKQGYVTATQGVTVPDVLDQNVVITPAVPNADIGGLWTVTFTPHPSCPSLTKPAARKYQAFITQLGARVEIAFAGASFPAVPKAYGTLHGTNLSITAAGGCATSYCYYGPVAPALAEQLPGGKALTIEGIIAGAVRGSSITATLNGRFQLVTSPTPPFTVLNSCENEHHPVTFTR